MQSWRKAHHVIGVLFLVLVTVGSLPGCALFGSSDTAPLLQATAEQGSGKLLLIAAQPRVLPYPECPAAAGNIARLIGLPLASLRQQVLVMLRRELGCTHLNDALRALAEVPALIAGIDARQQPAS